MTAVSGCWNGAGNAQLQTGETTSLDDSLQFLSDGRNSPYSGQQDTIGEFVNNANQKEKTVPFVGEPIAVSSEDEAEFMMVTSYPHPHQVYESNDPHVDDHMTSAEDGSALSMVMESDTCVSLSVGGTAQAPVGSMADASVLRDSHWSEGGMYEEPPHTISSFGLGQSQSRAVTTAVPTSRAMTSFPSAQLEKNGPMKVPSQKPSRAVVSSKLSGAQPGSGSTSSAQSIARDYYGGQILPNRLVTSGMVRLTPSRQPIKSLDLGFTGSANTEVQPHLQVNDRAAAMHYNTRTEGGRKPTSMLNSARGYTDGPGRGRIQGIAGLMNFHSQQSLRASDVGRNRPFLTSGVTSTIQPHETRVPRHKVCSVL